MTGEYSALRSLQNSDGWKVLTALWAKQGLKVMEGLQKAAAKGQESAWRYYAGQMKGFDIAITQLDRALMDMEREDENRVSSEQSTVEELLKSIKKDQS